MVRIAVQAGRIDLVQVYVKRAKEDSKLSRIKKAAYRHIIDNYQSQLDTLLGQN